MGAKRRERGGLGAIRIPIPVYSQKESGRNLLPLHKHKQNNWKILRNLSNSSGSIRKKSVSLGESHERFTGSVYKNTHI